MTTQLKLALKVLARRKVFTAISLFGISATLAVLMVATAMIDSVVAARAPESRFDRALMIYSMGQYGRDHGITSPPGYGFLDRTLRDLPGAEKESIFSAVHSTAVYREGDRIDTFLRRTDGPYWDILDFRFVEGGPFSAHDDATGQQVAVITAELRSKLFDETPAVGRSFTLDGSRFRVVGVVDSVPFTRMAAFSEVWVPIGTIRSADYREQTMGEFAGMVLLKDRAAMPAAKREFAARVATIPPVEEKFATTVAGLDTPFEALARIILGHRSGGDGAARKLASVLGLLAMLFMLLPALNLITLNLSRIMERGSEIGVRRAFGAPRGALVRQFLFENVVVTLLGSLVGFLLAAALLPALNELAPIPNVQVSLNMRVFAWGMLLALVFAVLSGVYPAWRMSRLHPVQALRGGSQ